jgi:EF-hand domain pair
LAHAACLSLCASRCRRACVRQIFNLVDRDKGGSISKSELAQLMDTLAINASQQEIDLMVLEIDKNNDGEIQFEEFVAVMSRKVQATYTADEVKQAFKVRQRASGGAGALVCKVPRAKCSHASLSACCVRVRCSRAPRPTASSRSTTWSAR